MTKEVARLEPFQRTVAPETKLLPLTVKVKSGPPAVVEVGDKLEMLGTGAATIAKVRELELPISVVKTVTFAEPTEAISLAGIWAVNWVGLT